MDSSGAVPVMDLEYDENSVTLHLSGDLSALMLAPVERQLSSHASKLEKKHLLWNLENITHFDTAAALILKTILLHISFDTTPEWPNPATLTEAQQRQFVDLSLFRLVRVMLLVDSMAWNLFDYTTDEHCRGEILASMEKTLKIISK